MDCSGLVQLVYKQLGFDLPRLSADQARQGTPVASMAEAKPGDLIAWDNSSRNNGADHIAIYVGNGKMIEAPRTGLDIRLVDVPSTPDYIRRILPEPGRAAPPRSPEPALPAAPSRACRTPTSSTRPVRATASARPCSPPWPSRSRATSPTRSAAAGAQGLMQLMPGTAKGLGVTNSFDPAQAVDGAARMLRDLTNRFGRTTSRSRRTTPARVRS